nr:uncharacterized protein LOC106679950 [Halyomorpha halys]
MIKYLFFIISIYQVCQSSVLAISIPDQQLLSPILQDIEDPQTLPGPNISSPDDTAEVNDIVGAFNNPPGMVKCMPGFCCLPGQTCGPFKMCYKGPGFSKSVAPMVPC